MNADIREAMAPVAPVTETGRREQEQAVFEMELRAYLALPQVAFRNADGTRANPLAWWRKHESLYPNLARLARRYLCIPATSASVERLFSVAGLVLTQLRSRLKSDIADDLITLRTSWGLARNYENEKAEERAEAAV